MVPATIHPSAIRLSSMLKVGLGGTQYRGLATACRDHIKLTSKWCGTGHCSYWPYHASEDGALQFMWWAGFHSMLRDARQCARQCRV